MLYNTVRMTNNLLGGCIMKKRLISFDWAIKKVLRSKTNFGILEGFLSELIAPDKDLKIVKILDPESNKETEDNKCNRVDILVELEPGDIVLIEIQVNRELNFLHRMLFGTSKVITEYLAEGEAYAKIKKVYSVNILYFDLGQGKDYIYKGVTDFIGIHNHDHLQLNERQKHLYKKDLISEIYPEYFIIKINNFNDLARNTLDEWIYFFKNEDIKPEFSAKGLLKAKNEFDILNLSEEERKAYARYLDNLHYQASMVESSYGEGIDKGIEKGIKKGIEQGIMQVAQKMLHNNLSIETIAKITGLTIAEIKDIDTKNK